MLKPEGLNRRLTLVKKMQGPESVRNMEIKNKLSNDPESSTRQRIMSKRTKCITKIPLTDFKLLIDTHFSALRYGWIKEKHVWHSRTEIHGENSFSKRVVMRRSAMASTRCNCWWDLHGAWNYSLGLVEDIESRGGTREG